MPPLHGAPLNKLIFRSNPLPPNPLPLPHVYGDWDAEELEWLKSVDAERRRLGKVTLTPREILALAHRIGYRRIIDLRTL